ATGPDPAQLGDGYSWVVSLLPFAEENVLFDKIRQGSGQFRWSAFATGTEGNIAVHRVDPNGGAVAANPYVWEVEIEPMLCPSYPGDPTTTDFPAPTSLADPAVGNYIALPSTHYLQSGNGLATSGSGQDSPPANCTGSLCGNGVLAFPGRIGTGNNAPVNKRGNAFRSMVDGTSKTVMFTESKERRFTSWYSGFASYGVATWPNTTGNGTAPIREATAGDPNQGAWTHNENPNGASLNRGNNRTSVGDNNANQREWYMPSADNPHGNVNVLWGPSSQHPGVVQHGWGDGHGSAISDQVDPDVYLWVVTRNGRETLPEGVEGL
ncbi:MAG: DUF1559 domain-containing protein, partial [Planctomycetota bacterium]